MEFNSTVELLLAETEPKKVQAPPPAAAAEVQVVPLLVKIFPDVPGATDATAEVPLPTNTALAVSVVAPVPPLATGNVPVTSDARLTFPAVIADVPLPLTTPVSVVAPVPPLATGSVPLAELTLTGGITEESVAMLRSD